MTNRIRHLPLLICGAAILLSTSGFTQRALAQQAHDLFPPAEGIEDEAEIVRVQSDVVRAAISFPQTKRPPLWKVAADGQQQAAFHRDDPENSPLDVTILIDATEGVEKERYKYYRLTEQLQRMKGSLRDAQVQVFVAAAEQQARVIPFQWPRTWPTQFCRDLNEATALSIKRALRAPGARHALLILTTRIGTVPRSIFSDLDGQLAQAAAFIFVASARPQLAPTKGEGERFIARGNLSNVHIAIRGGTDHYEPLLKFFVETAKRMSVVSFQPAGGLLAGPHRVIVEVSLPNGEVLEKQIRDFNVPAASTVALEKK